MPLFQPHSPDSCIGGVHVEYRLDFVEQNVGYIGDDVNDIQLFDRVGICAAPSDATNPIKEASDFVLNSTGGHGCIREFMRYHPELKGQL